MTEIVKGFKDTLDASKKLVIKNIIENIFKLYNYDAVETPIIEYEKFVKGNNSQDEAVSDIFKLKDKGKRNLALRYEFTFQLKRIAKNKKLPYKRYQIGQVFRDEPVTGNRWREFTQCDTDIVGSNIKDEAEILNIASKILKKLEIKATININNRKLLNEILEKNKIKEKNKSNIIKELDKLDKLPEKEIKNNLKKYDAEKILNILKKSEKYFERYESYSEIKELKNYCKIYNLKVNFQPFLARGLSYYNGTIFEIKSDLKETIAAGGSYLINNIQSTGISFGLDRIELIAKIKTSLNKTLIISLNQDKKSIALAEKLRDSNLVSDIYYGKPGKALDYANSKNIPFVIFVGNEEVKKEKYKLKNMNTGKEKLISEINLIKELNKFN